MTLPEPWLAAAPTHRLSRDQVAVLGDLRPLLDFLAILLGAWLATRTLVDATAIHLLSPEFWSDRKRAALAVAVLGAFVLHDQAVAPFISDRRRVALMAGHVARYLMFVALVIGLGVLGGFLNGAARDWLLLLFAYGLVITTLGRGWQLVWLRRQERNGSIVETVAVVGAGARADRLIVRLRETLGANVEIVGVFDDRRDRSGNVANRATGSIAELVNLGKSRALDWVLITLPDSAEARRSAIVQRLKALAVPVAIDAPAAGLARGERQRSAPTLEPGLELTIDDHDLDSFVPLAASFGQRDYGYVVTPNADHLLRLHREPSFRALYADAAWVLLDSRFIGHLLRLTRGLQLPLCTGSDLTAALFARVIRPDDRLIVIGGSDEQSRRLAARYGLTGLVHFNPPMGFIHDPAAVEACLAFVEAHSPFRFCLLAVGCPQQEMLAQRLKQRGRARGLALCIGASINFLTGDEQRAPRWLQRCGLEWLFRLMRSPRRLARRYLIQGPKLFAVLGRTGIQLRGAVEQGNHHVPSAGR